MESEEYYDSLDEDSNYGSVHNEFFENDEKPPRSENETTKKRFESKEVQAKPSLHSEAVEIFIPIVDDDVIPFYEKNLNKSAVNLENINVNYSGESGNNKNKGKKRPWRKKSLIPVGKLRSKSYLDMFHAKTTVSNDNKSGKDTSRATCSDLSPKSYTLDSDRISSFSKSPNYSENNSFYEGSTNKNEFSLSLASLDSKFCSVSQQNLSKISLKSRRKITFSKPLITKIPELGGLGPEIQKEKLDVLKKRQLYGQKVSENNKIKMEERRLLHSLQREINRCKNI